MGLMLPDWALYLEIALGGMGLWAVYLFLLHIHVTTRRPSRPTRGTALLWYVSATFSVAASLTFLGLYVASLVRADEGVGSTVQVPGMDVGCGHDSGIAACEIDGDTLCVGTVAGQMCVESSTGRVTMPDGRVVE